MLLYTSSAEPSDRSVTAGLDVMPASHFPGCGSKIGLSRRVQGPSRLGEVATPIRFVFHAASYLQHTRAHTVQGSNDVHSIHRKLDALCE